MGHKGIYSRSWLSDEKRLVKTNLIVRTGVPEFVSVLLAPNGQFNVIWIKFCARYFLNWPISRGIQRASTDCHKPAGLQFEGSAISQKFLCEKRNHISGNLIRETWSSFYWLMCLFWWGGGQLSRGGAPCSVKFNIEQSEMTGQRDEKGVRNT